MMGAVVRTLVLLSLLVATHARAEPDPTAAQLFDQGDALEAEGKYVAACPLFERSFNLNHATGAELRLADCDEHIGKLVLAWQLFDAAQAEWTRTGDSRGTFARQRRDALAARVALVELVLVDPLPAGLAVTLAGKPVAAAAPRTRAAVDPGSLSIVVSAPGHLAFQRTVTATVGEQLTVAVPALEPAPATATPPIAPPPPAATSTMPTPAPQQGPRSSHARVVTSLVVAGASLASLAVAGGLSLAAYDLYHTTIDSSDCMGPSSAPRCNSSGVRSIASATTEADTATVFAIVGAAGAVAAGVLYFTRPRDHVVVAPTATPSSVGMALSGWF